MLQARSLIVVVIIGVAVLSRGVLFGEQSQRAPAPPRATDSGLALSNLNSQIASLQKLVVQFSEHFKFRSQLFDLVAVRVQFLGRFDDLALLRSLVSDRSEKIEELLLRARYLSTIHDFSGARALLDRARTLQPTNLEIPRQVNTIRIALREGLPQLREEMVAVAKQNPTYSNFVQLAAVEGELGSFESADKNFQNALDAYRDTLPFPMAFIYFQRGVMWAEKAGDAKRAKAFYQQAVRYLPEYVVAQVHLAEILKDDGEIEAAESGLQKVLETPDPEPKGLLAEIYMAIGKDEKPLVHAATAAYNALLAEYPLAFADHGAEFFAGPGADPARGLALAKANLGNRRTERAYIVAIEAAQAAGASEDACSLADAAKKLDPVFIPLQELIANLKCSA